MLRTPPPPRGVPWPSLSPPSLSEAQSLPRASSPPSQYFHSATKASYAQKCKMRICSLSFLAFDDLLQPCLAPSTLTCSPPCLAGACLSLPCLPFPWTIHLHCDLSLHGAACSLRHAACSLRHAACSLKHQEVGPCDATNHHPSLPPHQRPATRGKLCM